eukprot:TRINITY_DN732_c0_g1_i2.p1 TRINITY_DN732_c0_g1~~TRINITY_DN732_c0_g1_i2.p1  ORF type:complete len:195 (+),score=39.63 TRINITY_DN732_c0_g1_i2:62-646(+)
MSKCASCNLVTGVTPTHCCHACSVKAGTHGPRCQKVPFLSGNWTDGTVPTPSSITQCGNQITVVNTTQPWSPSVGTVHSGGKVDFQSGGLAALVGAVNAAGEIQFTNGVKWTVIPPLHGAWAADQGASNLTQITQVGPNITVTNPGQPWSPSTGIHHPNNTITFSTGGLVGITGTFNGAGAIAFSNGCTWTKTA